MFETFLENEENAIAVLKRDHQKVKDLFDQFEEADGLHEQVKITAAVIKELKMHAVIEEEIFYPAVREVVGGDIMNEADEEHHIAKVLIAELEKMTGAEEHFEAKFKVLAENIRHHIKEEESNMLPKAKEAQIDFDILGETLLARKKSLMKNGFPVSAEEKMVRAGKGKSVSAPKKSKVAKSKKIKPHVIASKRHHAHAERS